MLRMIQSSSAAQARRYYTEGLGREDYYVEGQEMPGVWGGKGAELLGLSGEVSQEAFHHLCENRRPDTGDRLTARTRGNRRVGYDFNFHCPKGVSIAYALGGDERIVQAVELAVTQTMKRMEEEASTRVRVGGKNETRVTGNLVWASFLHKTARPVGGIPDPHLHVHCYVFNATYDRQEERWKAGDFSELKRSAPFFEALFHATLEHSINQLGYETEERGKRWDLKCTPESVTGLFSRRTHEIEKVARERGITDAADRSGLGASTRRSKSESCSPKEVFREWTGRVSSEQLEAIRGASKRSALHQDSIDLSSEPSPSKNKEQQPEVSSSRAARKAVTRALEHCFERASVSEERRVMTAAVRFARGRVSEEALQAELDSRDLIRETGKVYRTLLSTKEKVAEENHLIESALEGIGRFKPWSVSSVGENSPEHSALEHVLLSKDRVTLVRTPPSLDQHELRDAFQKATGEKLMPLSPTASGRSGDIRVVTVGSFLADREKQRKAKGAVIWVEEAGRLGANLTGQLLQAAKSVGSRVVLAGDTKRHGPGGGGAMEVLSKHTNIKTQDGRLAGEQRAAAEDAKSMLRTGSLVGALAAFRAAGAIHEMPRSEWAKELAANFQDAQRRNRRFLVLAAKLEQARVLAEELRAELKELGFVKRKDRKFQRLTQVPGTEAEKKDAAFYKAGQLIQFRQHTKGFRAGQHYTVVGRDPFGNVLARKGAFVEALPLGRPDRFKVYTIDSINLAVGDHVRMTRSGYARSKPLFPGALGRPKRHRVTAGATQRIAGFSANGDIRLESGVVLPKDYAHWEHGLSSTTFQAQGQKADQVVLCVDEAISEQALQTAGAVARRKLSLVTESVSAVEESLWSESRDVALDLAASPRHQGGLEFEEQKEPGMEHEEHEREP